MEGDVYQNSFPPPFSSLAVTSAAAMNFPVRSPSSLAIGVFSPLPCMDLRYALSEEDKIAVTV